MNTYYPFPWESFFSLFIIGALIPTLIGAVFIWRYARSSRNRDPLLSLNSSGPKAFMGWTTGGRCGLWATGLFGALLGFLSGLLWLSWSAAGNDGSFVTPAIQVPGSFPAWQVVLCGAFVVGIAVVAALSSKRLNAGALAAALGTAAGFTTWFAMAVATPVTSQEGIGVAMSIVGVTFSLSVSNYVVALIRAKKIKS